MYPQQPPYGGPPQHGPGMGGYGPPPGPPGPPPGMPGGWGPPPPRKPGNGAAVAVIVIFAALVVLVGGGAAAWWLYDVGSAAESAASVPTPSGMPTSPTGVPGYSPPAVPAGSPTSGPGDLPTGSPTMPTTTRVPTIPTQAVFDPHRGDCVRNSGTYTRPILHMSGCTSGHYRVLHRYNGTTDRRRCAVGTYAVWFTSPKYILCMRRI